MKKKIILFGYGIRGKRFLNCYFEYGGNLEIVAIADNNKAGQTFADIPVILPECIRDYKYDEIWLCTQYDNKAIREQLVYSCCIDNKKIVELDTPVHLYLLDERIREKYHEVINGNIQCDDPEKQEVLDFLKRNKVKMYCYSFCEKYIGKDSSVFLDEQSGLFYALYKSKKMYLARRINTIEKARTYFNAMCMEQDTLSPHKYLTEKFLIDDHDIGMDIGAAEGIFALEVIDKVDFMYLVETDKEWLEALQLTFQDYGDKICIIDAFVSDMDDNRHITIDTLLEGKKINFIKMDIEGEEINALRGAKKTLADQKVKLAVCSYHHSDDYSKICAYFTEAGYKTDHAKGYVICVGEWEKENEDIDFRRAIIFADKEGR